TKLTVPTGPTALVDFQTPPPVVPTYTVFPVASAGSTATAVTRPLTFPYAADTTDPGPTACHAALKGATCCAKPPAIPKPSTSATRAARHTPTHRPCQIRPISSSTRARQYQNPNSPNPDRRPGSLSQ